MMMTAKKGLLCRQPSFLKTIIIITHDSFPLPFATVITTVPLFPLTLFSLLDVDS